MLSRYQSTTGTHIKATTIPLLIGDLPRCALPATPLVRWLRRRQQHVLVRGSLLQKGIPQSLLISDCASALHGHVCKHSIWGRLLTVAVIGVPISMPAWQMLYSMYCRGRAPSILGTARPRDRAASATRDWASGKRSVRPTADM